MSDILLLTSPPSVIYSEYSNFGDVGYQSIDEFNQFKLSLFILWYSHGGGQIEAGGGYDDDCLDYQEQVVIEVLGKGGRRRESDFGGEVW